MYSTTQFNNRSHQLSRLFGDRELILGPVLDLGLVTARGGGDMGIDVQRPTVRTDTSLPIKLPGLDLTGEFSSSWC